MNVTNSNVIKFKIIFIITQNKINVLVTTTQRDSKLR